MVDQIDYIVYQGEKIKLSTKEKEQLLEQMDSKYLKDFEKFNDKNNFGISFSYKFTCSHCKKEHEVTLVENSRLIDFF